MKNEALFNLCKDLALKDGYMKEQASSIYAVFEDPYGCDLKIYYYDMILTWAGVREKSKK